jgi:hypothetical protein
MLLLSDRNHSKHLSRALYWWSSRMTPVRSFLTVKMSLFQFNRQYVRIEILVKTFDPQLKVAILRPFNI